MIGPLYVLYQTRHFREKHLYSYFGNVILYHEAGSAIDAQSCIQEKAKHNEISFFFSYYVLERQRFVVHYHGQIMHLIEKSQIRHIYFMF